MEYRIFGKITTACLWLVLTMGGANAQQSYNPSWSSYVGGDYDMDGTYAVATDSATNSYLGGFGYGSIRSTSDLPATEPPYYQAAQDGFVAKVNPNGSLAWHIWLGASNDTLGENDRVSSLAIHTNGMLYAAGVLARTDNDDNGTDALLAFIDSGQTNVTHTLTFGNSNGTNGFNAVAVDSNGYVYAVGYTTFSGLPNIISGTQYRGDTDACVVKISPAGAVVWSHYLGGTNADTATACAVGPDGSVYVGGETRSPGWATLSSGTPSPANSDGFLVKLTPAGAAVWSTFIGGSGADAVTALAADPSSATLVLGGSASSSVNFLSGVTNLNSHAGGIDGFVVSLTESGATFQTNWCRFFGGGTADLVTSVAVQAGGKIMTGGTTASGSWLTQAGASAFGGVQDGFLSQLNSDGSVAWSTYVGGANNDELRSLASRSGTLLAAGSTFSPSWVSGGFWTDWTKDTDYDGTNDFTAPFGFLSKWSTEPGVPPTLTADPTDATVQEGEPASFHATATGTPTLTYRWLRNGVPVTGLTSNTYVIAAAAATNNNDLYSCLVSNIYGTATSQTARLTVILKGTLAVTLAPAEAVAQGARWSLDSGATWLTGGSTNLPPGAYSVTFTNLTGWIAPAPLAGVQVASGATTSTSGVYTAVLPSAARSIAGTNVTVVVRAPAGLSAWTLVETLAPGLTPTAYTAGGVWNSTAHTLTFTGVESTTTTLSYSVSCASSGVYTVSGTVTPQPANVPVAVTGPSQIIKGNIIRTISGKSVTLSVYQPNPSFVWSVYETLAVGLTPTNITGSIASWNPATRTITWFNVGVVQTLSYGVTGEPGTYTLSGYGHVTAVDEPIFGDSVLTIPGAEIPPPNILSLIPMPGANTCTLSFTSVVNQAYLILTNATLQATNAWAGCLPVTGDAGVTQRQVPMAGPSLFYRVRITP